MKVLAVIVAVYAIIMITALVVGVWVGVIFQHANILRHDDIKINSRSDGRYLYHFHDPYGSMISHGGYRTEQGARRAAERERKKVAKKLQEVCGL